MNVNESAKIKNILEKMGYGITEDIYASDVVFLNTCTVREGAAAQIYGKIGELKSIKRDRGTIIGVTGCFAQEQGAELIRRFPAVDIVMGNQNIGQIPDLLTSILKDRKNPVVAIQDENRLPGETEADFGDGVSASIAISYGCDNFCAYCIVPYVRGRERSVPVKSILKTAEDYLRKGCKEILLLGQNVNSYGKDLGDGTNFAGLLKALGRLPGEFLIRFVSPHPRDFTPELMDVIAADEKIARCIHLPLQSGSTRILKRMNRGYGKEEYLALATAFRQKIPGIALTTDIIVGFPGEEEEDFLDTLDVVQKAAFDNAFMFMYSVRRGTRAAEMDGQIEEEIKKERLRRLMDVQNRLSKKSSEAYQGKMVKVLVEGPSKKNKAMQTGRTSTNKIVLFAGSEDLKGRFVNIHIQTCKTWTLYGNIT
jgi:tRNA-2-methylthio-N6-dimethylallyladenosine synthase